MSEIPTVAKNARVGHPQSWWSSRIRRKRNGLNDRGRFVGSHPVKVMLIIRVPDVRLRDDPSDFFGRIPQTVVRNENGRTRLGR